MRDTTSFSGLATAELVELARGRDPSARAAWDVLVERHVPLVWKMVRCFDLPREAQWEAFQSAWLRAIERLGTLQDPKCFPGWLATIARNETLGVIRARKKLTPGTVPDLTAQDAPPGERLHRDELIQAVREGLASLEAPCRNLLSLLSADPPVPYQEIELALDIRHGSIGPTRRRCLEKLRKTPSMAALLPPDGE